MGENGQAGDLRRYRSPHVPRSLEQRLEKAISDSEQRVRQLAGPFVLLFACHLAHTAAHMLGDTDWLAHHACPFLTWTKKALYAGIMVLLSATRAVSKLALYPGDNPAYPQLHGMAIWCTSCPFT